MMRAVLAEYLEWAEAARYPAVRVRPTQVLLRASVLLRRADAVTVIGTALLAKASGAGHRPIAVMLGVPSSTVCNA